METETEQTSQYVGEQALLRELGPHWRARLSANPTPLQEVEAWAQDAQRVHEAALILYHRRAIERLRNGTS